VKKMVKWFTRGRSLRLVGMVGLIGLIAFLSPASAVGNPGPEGKVLRVREYKDLITLDPAFTISASESHIMRAIYSGLVRFKPGSYEWEPDAAEWINVSDDGKVIEFKLKEGIQFHGGYGEMTAEDVKFSYERIIDPAVDSPYSYEWATLDHVEVTGKYTGKIILSEPFAPLWHTVLPADPGLIISQKAYEERGEAFATNPIGSGHFYFAGWTPKQKIVLKRFDQYYGQKPDIEEINIYPIEDDKSAELAFDAGQLDFTAISLSSAARYEADPNVNLRRAPSLAYVWLAINVKQEPFTDVRVRRAIRYAVDVDAILQGVYGGEVEPAKGPIAAGLLGHWADAPVYRVNLDEAKRLLAEAGYPDGFKTKLAAVNTVLWKTMAEIIQANLAEIGIAVEIDLMDSATFDEITFDPEGEGVYMLLERYAGEPDPNYIMEWFTCDQVGEWNAMWWCNPVYDKLLQMGIVALDERERDQIYIAMQMLMDADAIAVWFTNEANAFVAKKNVEMVILPHGDAQYHYFQVID
jgi:peptide/nickel transport system substrate-binding protein